MRGSSRSTISYFFKRFVFSHEQTNEESVVEGHPFLSLVPILDTMVEVRPYYKASDKLV